MVENRIEYIPIGNLKISKYNVRKETGDITDLVDSVRAVGILQPLLVRRSEGQEYEIIAGSRRFGAAKQAGLESVPVIIREISDEQAIIESLSENLQRGDLTLDEIAEAVELAWGLVEPTKFVSWPQFLENFASTLGKKKSWVENLVKAYRILQNIANKTGQRFRIADQPDEEQRKKGIISYRLVNDIENALNAQNVKNVLKDESAREAKKFELIDFSKQFTTEDARKIVQRFQIYPEKSVDELQKEVEAKKTFVPMPRTYVPPEVIREVEDFAKKGGKTVDTIMPEVVRRGLKFESEKMEIESSLKAAPKVIAERIREAQNISPSTVKKILDLQEEKQTKVLDNIQRFRMNEQEADSYISNVEKASSPEFFQQVESISTSYDQLRKEITANMQKEDMKERGKLYRNFTGHMSVKGMLETISCPVCGSNNLGWMCHHLDINKASQQVKEQYEHNLQKKGSSS